MSFKSYINSNLAPSTVERYEREISLFFLSLANKRKRPETATYSDVMEYLGELKKRVENRGVELSAIKKYYEYLIATNQRKDHPCKSIQLRDQRSKDIQLQDLFNTAELEQLLQRKERYIILKNRNKIVISFLIYQGLKNSEICNLTTRDIDLEQGTIYIKSSLQSNSRTLKLQAKQIYWLIPYIQEDRLKLLRVETDNLVISKQGTAESGTGISYLIETQKHLFKDRKLTTVTIRQSVITNLLKRGNDLRIVQAFAGHKTPSTTERYKQTQVEQLKIQILKYHPLG